MMLKICKAFQTNLKGFLKKVLNGVQFNKRSMTGTYTFL